MRRRDVLKTAAGVAALYAANSAPAADESELTASEVVRRIQEGQLRAEDYAAQLLKKYQLVKDLHPVTWIDEAKVLESARSVDRARARGERLASLAGLPLIIKDNISTIGFPTSAGTNALKKYLPGKNAPVVDTLFHNGAILLAKANMHELARGGTSTNPTFGIVKNPYDPSRIPGGSSGGTSVAVAARIAPAGLGTDTAGSVRVPAAFCGLAGLRPSTAGARKRYSDEGVIPLALDLDTIGPIARTVADVALLNAVITGSALPAPRSLKGVRIGVPRAFFWEDLDTDVAKVMDGTLGHLRDAGVTFVDFDVKQLHELAAQVFGTLIGVGGRDDLAAFLAKNVPGITMEDVIAGISTKSLKTRLERGRPATFASGIVEQARTVQRANIVRLYEAVFRTHGLSAIAYPTEPVPAPLINANGDTDKDVLEINGKKFAEGSVLARNTTMTCALGAPGLTVPVGLTSQGLPVGMELSGLAGEDEKLLGLGMAVEAIVGRLPPPRGRGTN
jgi:indoleacetamide hydrolase